MTTFEIILLTLALLIISVLTGIAIWLWIKVFEQNKKRLESERKLQEMAIEKQDYLVESIEVIARNMVENDLNISEGSIRLKVLIDNLAIPDQEKRQFDAFNLLYEEVKELDTHQARKNLPKTERQKQDKHRIAEEARLSDEVLAAAKLAMSYPFKEKLILSKS